MIKDYNEEFGPGGIYAWPADLDVAGRLLEAAPCEKSSADCLDDDFFSEYLDHLDDHIFEEFPEEEAYELAEAARKFRQELFKDATEWPLPCLVASAVYNILSTETEQIHMISNLWRELFWPFLCFDEPLSDMVKSKGWGKTYRKELREGFKLQLRFEIHGLTGNRLMWGNDKDKPWLTCQYFASHIYAEDVLRCLDLVGVDPALAHSAVDKVFKLQSLTPLYRVLSDDPSLTIASNVTTPATVVRRRHRGEEGEIKSPNKPSTGIRIDVLKFIVGALVVAAAVIASKRVRSSHSNWALTQPVLALNEPGPSTRKVPWESRQPAAQNTTDVTAPALQRSLLKKITANLYVSRKTIARWSICNALESQSSALENQPFASQSQPSVGIAQEPQTLRKQKSAVHFFRQKLSDAKTEAQKLGRTVYEALIKRVDDRRIFIDGSKAFRTELAAKNKMLPDDTVLCIHAHKTKTKQGKEVLMVTTQGTVTDCNRQKDVMTYIKQHFLIDGQSVQAGESHENDHVWGTMVASIGDLRHSNPAYDRARTVKLTKPLHALRTAHYANVKPRYSLENFKVDGRG